MKLSTGIAGAANVALAAVMFLGIALSGLISIAPGAYAAGEIAVGGKVSVVNTDGDTIRMRAGAGTEFDQVGEAYEGQTLSVLAGPSRDTKNYRWFKVQGPGGTGWIVAGYLEGTSAPSQVPTKAQISKIAGNARVANTDGDQLRLRSTPGSNGKIITTLDAGTVVSVKQGPLTDTEGVVWYQVSAKGITGWVMGRYLAQAQAQIEAQTVKSTPKLAGYARVANTDGDSVRVRAASSRSAVVVSALDPDAIVTLKRGPVTDAEGIGWYQVSANGLTGWVMGEYLAQSSAPTKPAVEARPAVAEKPVTKKPAADTNSSTNTKPASDGAIVDTSSSGSGARIVSIAMQYVGYPYVWGGTTPRGFDCTGFLYYVYNKAGVRLPRDMASQFNSGLRISRSDLQPGDLLFWSNTYKRGLSHAGIYIGNGRFVNAENTGTGVAVSSLNTAYWASRYTGAVRPR